MFWGAWREKGMKRVISNIQVREVMWLQTKEIIRSKERQKRQSATKHVLINSNFLCFAHTASYQLLPDWLSCPACIVMRDDWQAWRRFWYLNAWPCSSFRVNLLRTICWCACVCVVGIALCLCVLLGVCTEWGLVLIHKHFFPDKAEEQPASLSPFSRLLPFSRR